MLRQGLDFHVPHAEVLNADSHEEVLPILAIIDVDTPRSVDSLHARVPQNEVLYLHALVDPDTELLEIDLSAPILINVHELVGSEARNCQLGRMRYTDGFAQAEDCS